MKHHNPTITTYNRSAIALAEYFKGIGARTNDIKLALKLAGVTDKSAWVIEIGCGDGRDATEIVKVVKWYEGFDPSEGLLRIARKKLPKESFVISDAMNYKYPKNLDVIYAFASLLHVDKNELQQIFQKLSSSLRLGGVAFISLKERDKYTHKLKEDKFGERLFFYYNPSTIKHAAGVSFETIYEDHQLIGETRWFTIALKKIKTQTKQ